MADFKVKYISDESKVVKTITFRGHKYSEIWKGDICKDTITSQLCRDYPELEEDIEEILDVITGWSDDEEIIEALEELGEYE